MNAKKFSADADNETQMVKNLIWEAIEAGFYNIDIDTSTLVDLSQPTVKDQQRTNFTLAAELTTMIRDLEPEGITVSVGGEIGEVGGKNSTVEELEAFMEGYLEENRRLKTKSAWDTVTQREREVLKLLSEGYLNKEIADFLHISVKTVEKHRANIMGKLDLHNASALTAFAIEKGLVTRTR